jgi:hypothetical protein
MIDRREDPEDKEQWREPANREPPEFDADKYTFVTLRRLFWELEVHGFSREEAKALATEVIEHEF